MRRPGAVRNKIDGGQGARQLGVWDPLLGGVLEDSIEEVVAGTADGARGPPARHPRSALRTFDLVDLGHEPHRLGPQLLRRR